MCPAAFFAGLAAPPLAWTWFICSILRVTVDLTHDANFEGNGGPSGTLGKQAKRHRIEQQEASYVLTCISLRRFFGGTAGRKGAAAQLGFLFMTGIRWAR